MQDRVLQLMQLIQYRTYGTFSTSITNHFIGVDVQLSKISLNEIGITTRIHNLQIQHNTRTGIEITNIQTKHQRIICTPPFNWLRLAEIRQDLVKG